MTADPRVLVIVAGQMRGGPLAWRSLNLHLIRPNQADLAIIGPGLQPQHQRLLNVKYVWNVTDYKDWGQYFENHRDFSSSSAVGWRDAFCGARSQQRLKYDKWSQFAFLSGVKSCNHGPGSGGILLAYRHMLYTRLQSDNLLTKYDWFIFTRSDYLYLCPPPRPTQLDNTMIHLPRGEGWGGYTDRFAIIPTRLALTYFNLTNDVFLDWPYWASLMEDDTFKGNIEAVLKRYFERRDTPISLFIHSGFIVKLPSDPTKFRANEKNWKSDHQELGRHRLTLKYVDEVKEAELACSPWNGFRKWAANLSIQAST